MAVRRAVVWGASGGMGSALVRRLKANNWIVQAGARHPSRIPQEADTKFRFDACDSTTFIPFPAELKGSVDLMVYTAGSIHAESLEKFEVHDLLDTLKTHIAGPLLATQTTLPLMKEGGHLMYIGAYVPHLVFPKMGVQAAAKAALEPLIATWAKENRKVKFTIVRPGPVDTPFWKSAPVKLPKNAKQPEVVADAILQRFEQGQGGDLDL